MTAIVTPTPIDDLPATPLPTDTIPDFNTKAFALVAALEDFVDQTNASATATEQNATAANERAVLADASADAAALSEAAAASSAASAIGAPGTNATSTTSLSLTAGTKSWTIQTGKLFPPGVPFFLASAANPSVNRMYGILATHDNTTGACTGTLTPDPGASGTHTDWIMGLGVSLAGTATLPRIARTSNTALTVAEKGKLIDVTSGTFTQTTDTAANLTPDWFCYLANTGTGVVTLAGLALVQGAQVMLHSDGTTVRVYPERLPDQIMIVRDEKTLGTAGGASVGGTWNLRTLNTVSKNTIASASVASNQVSLPAGTFRFIASAPCYGGNAHQLRLYSVTASATLAFGVTCYIASTSQTQATLFAEITLAVPTTVRIDHYVTTTAASGLGQPVNAGTEVYAELFIQKVG